MMMIMMIMVTGNIDDDVDHDNDDDDDVDHAGEDDDDFADWLVSG